MSIKKIGKVLLFASVLVLVASSASAAGTPTQTQYTPEQQACIIAKSQPGIKAAQDALATATPVATAKRIAANNAAEKVLENKTPVATKIKAAAIKAAQSIADSATKASAIQTAQDAYKNDPSVKGPFTVYTATVLANQNAFRNDPSVKGPLAIATEAVKTAKAEAIKECTNTTVDTNSIQTSIDAQTGAPASLSNISVLQSLKNTVKSILSFLSKTFSFSK